jgi:hypothetical protein
VEIVSSIKPLPPAFFKPSGIVVIIEMTLYFEALLSTAVS